MDTPTSSTGPYTPTTSAAPSTVADGPVKKKLPLAVRKNVRDEWESKQKELEASLSALLGADWHVSIDAEVLYPMAEERFAKESPGVMFREYVEAAIGRLRDFVDKYGDDGKADLNRMAASHVVTIAPTDDPKIEYTGCDISNNGSLRLLFSKGNLGVNIDRPAEDVAGAINDAEVAMQKTSGAEATIGFHARSSIKADYDPRISQLRQNIQHTLALLVLELVPNFETNFAALAAYASVNINNNYDFPRDWQREFGKYCLEYFEAFAANVKELGFGTDELLREGFGEAVERNGIGLRVVERLAKGEYNECVVEGGVVFIQTTPGHWRVNVYNVGRDLVELL